jgi:hypothetical protein
MIWMPSAAKLSSKAPVSLLSRSRTSNRVGWSPPAGRAAPRRAASSHKERGCGETLVSATAVAPPPSTPDCASTTRVRNKCRTTGDVTRLCDRSRGGWWDCRRSHSRLDAIRSMTSAICSWAYPSCALPRPARSGCGKVAPGLERGTGALAARQGCCRWLAPVDSAPVEHPVLDSTEKRSVEQESWVERLGHLQTDRREQPADRVWVLERHVERHPPAVVGVLVDLGDERYCCICGGRVRGDRLSE